MDGAVGFLEGSRKLPSRDTAFEEIRGRHSTLSPVLKKVSANLIAFRRSFTDKMVQGFVLRHEVQAVSDARSGARSTKQTNFQKGTRPSGDYEDQSSVPKRARAYGVTLQISFRLCDMRLRGCRRRDGTRP